MKMTVESRRDKKRGHITKEIGTTRRMLYRDQEGEEGMAGFFFPPPSRARGPQEGERERDHRPRSSSLGDFSKLALLPPFPYGLSPAVGRKERSTLGLMRPPAIIGSRREEEEEEEEEELEKEEELEVDGEIRSSG